MKRTASLLVVFLCTSASFLGAGDAGKDDLKKVQGKWKVVFQIKDGKPLTVGEESIFNFSGNKNLFNGTGEDAYDSIKLNASSKPRSFDFDEVRGENTRKGLQGIYEIDGDSLKSCVALPGKDRPKAFEAKENSGHVLTVLKRIKEKT